MKYQPSHVAAALLVLVVGSLTAQPSAATSRDVKSVSPTVCEARGPDTTPSELTYGPYGITNPGTTGETIVCPIPADSETKWSSTPGASADLYIYYKIGSAPGNVSCTAFTGTAVVSSALTYSVSYSSPIQAAGTRGGFYLHMAESGGIYTIAPPTVLVCTLSPKAAIGWIYFQENLSTNTP